MIGFASRRVVLAVVLLVTLIAGAIVSAQRASSAMTTAATRLLASLTPEQRQQIVFSLDSAERLRWNFIPDEAFPRNGLPFKAMTEEQRGLAQALLRTGLSERGYMTYTSIMQLENILKVIEAGGRFARDAQAHRVSIFGDPSPGGTWGWRVEGHHVSLHFTVVNGVVAASTPSFAGSNPAEVRDGPQKGQRVLGQLEDAGRALVTALDAGQRATATINATAPNEIVTNNTLDITPLTPPGVSVAAMTPAQRDLMMRLLDAYAGLMATDIAADRMARIKASGIDKIGFAWAGPIERGQKHYYRVQGPTFLIEFDNTQNDGNHVHSVWRDFNGDFGRDVLRDHIKTAHLGTAAAGL
jgi:hypothetical protein